MALLDPNRLFPIEKKTKEIAKKLYNSIENIPIISPHGHTNPYWFSENKPFENPSELFITPDHYVFRMLFSQGVDLESLGVLEINTNKRKRDPKKIWKIFAKNYYLFNGTPTKIWLDYVFENLFCIDKPLNEKTADFYYEEIDDLLKKNSYLPRNLYEKFNIEILCTTESPLDDLNAHKKINKINPKIRIISAYRPDDVIDPENKHFIKNVLKFGEITNENTTTYSGYLNAHFKRRQYFKSLGTTSTDHGHPTANTFCLPKIEINKLFDLAISGKLNSPQSELFRGHMLLEMARMSCEDGLVMQLHPGSFRNHSPQIMKNFGRDKGFDIPQKVNFVKGLKPLLDELGLNKNLTLILFTLDESTLSREVAPLCGVYPSLKIGPPWWFFDSVEGMKRFRRSVTETAGFYNTVGFNDDTRAFCSIPARHDLSRRVDCGFLSELIASGQISENDGFDLAYQLSYGLAKKAYKL